MRYSDLEDRLKRELNESNKLRAYIQDVYSTFWKLFDTNKKRPNFARTAKWERLERKILKIFDFSKFEARKIISRLVWQMTQHIYRTDAGKSVSKWLLNVSHRIPDSMVHKTVNSYVIIRGNLEMISELTSVKTKIPVDLSDTSSIKKEHVKFLKTVIIRMGMHDINADFRDNKNLIRIASINDELTVTLEDHMIKKARRYKNFYHLVGYIENCPKADKRRFFVEIFKHKTHYNARVAIDRLKKHPELHKYFNLT